jgi:hypothetical protein
MQFYMGNQNIILILWFEQIIIAHYQVFDERLLKKKQNYEIMLVVFGLYRSENGGETSTIYYQNVQHKKLYKPWKFHQIWKYFPNEPGDFWWIHPYTYMICSFQSWVGSGNSFLYRIHIYIYDLSISIMGWVGLYMKIHFYMISYDIICIPSEIASEEGGFITLRFESWIQNMNLFPIDGLKFKLFPFKF